LTAAFSTKVFVDAHGFVVFSVASAASFTADAGFLGTENTGPIKAAVVTSE
jgi:hypothetical protein